ncbi:MAG: nucleotidyltransferase family protein [Rhodobacteraceae bacterium]|nr:nucleotidyltransferase family protein [Paracoccaceae bacterium]MCY4138153.1 nucleotidyltransferase family protein [Paracoccaceae bacterium]
MTVRITVPSDKLAAFCERWQIVELAIFGSTLRDDFGPESDIDLLVSFREDARHSLFDMVRMERELETIFGRDVDLVERADIERSRNYLRRKAILEASETIYAT